MHRIDCPLENHKGEWIDRVDRVTIKQWNDWRAADHTRTQELIRELISDWNLKAANGKPAPKPSQDNALDALEIQLLPWLIQSLQESVLEDFKLPPGKSSPSPT